MDKGRFELIEKPWPHRHDSFDNTYILARWYRGGIQNLWKQAWRRHQDCHQGLIFICLDLFAMARTFREPAFPDTLFLLLHFEDAPEWWECGHTQNYGCGQVWYEQRCCSECYASQKEHPPALRTEIIFGLYDKRMEQSDYKKCREPYNNTYIVHISVFCCTNPQR